MSEWGREKGHEASVFCVCVFLIWSNTFFFSVLVPDPFNNTKNISIIFGLAQDARKAGQGVNLANFIAGTNI